VAGLLLAAGTSARMGRPKQLLPVGGKRLLDIVLGETLRSDLDTVVLVLGHMADDITAGLSTDLHHPKLRIIENNRFREGISSSIIAGLSEVENACDHVMIILADMPHLTAGLINLLLYQYLESGLPLAGLKIENRRSHPVIISRKFYPDVHQLRGDVGARDLFLKYADQVCLVDAGESYDDMDIDTMADYLDLKKSFEDNP